MMVSNTTELQAMAEIKNTQNIHKNSKPHYNYNDTSTVSTKITEVKTIVTQNEPIAIKLKNRF
jgi:hypothetical protein